MLKKLHRLRKNRDFNKTFKKATRFETENLTFRVAKTSDGADIRFGFVVPNSIDKRATRRNGLKRRIRGVVRENIEKLPCGFDVIITVKKVFSYPYKYNEIEKQVIEGLQKAKLLS